MMRCGSKWKTFLKNSTDSWCLDRVMAMMKFSHRVIFVGASLFITVTLYLFLSVQTILDTHQVHGRKLLDAQLWPLRDSQSVMISSQSSKCSFGSSYNVSANISTLQIFDAVSFRTFSDGSYALPTVTSPPRTDNKNTKIAEPLRVIVVPHSHNDPGWVKTLDEYYIDQTQHILSNMVERLTKYPNMTFVWAETVFLSIWWNGQEDDVRLQARRLIRKGQLEIVPGGWVVPDEASTHYFSLIDQLIEGHQWILDNINFKPVNSWSVDSFGHSATVSYLWKQAGLENMVIQRVHGSVKGYLAQRKSLEFHWRQSWDTSGSTDILCHVMPYALYSVKYSCGPDCFMCLLFDFRKIAGEAGEAKGKTIDDSNIESQATYLYEQYRKKASLYRHGAILVHLGDDFRYDKAQEWQQQHDNYMALFDYMNSRKEWNIKAGFGTLKDYFAAIKSSGQTSTIEAGNFPVLSGDFLPYSDRDNTYWSGYYSSRPFSKRASREVETSLRAAEILTTFANIYSKQIGYHFENHHVYLASLQKSRRNLALFQHHDAITGTSKEYVVGDYLRKLASAYNYTQEAVAGAMQLLLSKGRLSTSVNKLLPVDRKTMFLRFPEKSNISVSREGTYVVFFNPVGQTRKEIVHLNVDSDTVEVRDETDTPVPCQLNPVWIATQKISETKFEIVFPVELPPLGIVAYKLTRLASEPKKLYPAGIIMYNTLDFVLPSTSRLIQYRPDIGSPIVLQNEQLKATFSQRTGYLQSVVNKTSGRRTEMALEFLQYKSRGSGAYIFYPEGKAVPFEELPMIIRVIRGPIMSSVEVVHHQYLRHLVRFYNAFTVQSMGLHVENEIFLYKMAYVEVVMRLRTDLTSKQSRFFTDEIGYQFIRRKTYDKLPLQGNFYPITTACYLQDSTRRVTMHSGQSLGVAHLDDGVMEVMIERALIYDDDRGLGEGLQDNKPTRLYFILQMEHSKSEHSHQSQLHSCPSIISSVMNSFLQNQLQTFYATQGTSFLSRSFKPLKEPLPCDISVVNLRNMVTSLMTENGTALILHRHGFDCDYSTNGLSCNLSQGELNLNKLLSDISLKDMREMSLSYLHELQTVKNGVIRLSPMQISAFHVQW